jgi:hypothetical protein
MMVPWRRSPAPRHAATIRHTPNRSADSGLDACLRQRMGTRRRIAPDSFRRRNASLRARRNSATGTRTRVARVRAEYPNQLDYGGACNPTPSASYIDLGSPNMRF